MIEISDTQKIGVGLAGFGIAFLFLGVLLLFDKGLLAIGNMYLGEWKSALGFQLAGVTCCVPLAFEDNQAYMVGNCPVRAILIRSGYVEIPSKAGALSGIFQLVLCLILFLCGLACVIGVERTFRFFFQRHKVKATICFFGGIIVVLLGWPLIGMVIESYGFVLLFSGFFPVAINFLRRVPLLGSFLNLPIINKFVDRISGDAGRTRV